MKAEKRARIKKFGSRPLNDRRLKRSGSKTVDGSRHQTTPLNTNEVVSSTNVLQLQQTVGNRAVSRLISHGEIENSTIYRQSTANKAGGASKTGFTKVEITKDDTYKFKADTIAEVGQKLDAYMDLHGEVAHVAKRSSEVLRPDKKKIVRRAELTYNLERQLPEWTNVEEVGKKCPCWKKEWDRFEEAIKKHEQLHVDIYKKYLAGLHDKCVGLTEDKAWEELENADIGVEALQDEFDDKTEHGQNAKPSTKFNAGISCNGC